MTGIDVSQSHVLEEGRFEQETPYSREETVEIVATGPSYTDPMLIVDGTNRIRVFAESDSEYLIHLLGYVPGYLRVTEDGIREFGEKYLGAETEIPRWTIQRLPEGQEQLPWWVPDSYRIDQTVECVRCKKEVPPHDIVTPGRADGDVVDWFCPECWDDVSDLWSPEWAHAGKPDILRAEYLDRTVGGNPEEADVQELRTLVHSDEEKAQMHALTALGRIIPDRSDDVESLLPLFAETLESDVTLTRFGALSCMALLAEAHPEKVLSYADDVISLLEPTSDGGILEEGIRFVAAVAEEYPGHVQDAVPKLGRLLNENPPQEQDLLQALVWMAQEEPDIVSSITSDLRDYVDDEDSEHRILAIAALGYVAKESPAAVKDTIPTMIGLLDAEENRLRGNAVGVLADLSEEYPEELLFDLAQITALVDDDDENAQHNATYVLAQLAERYPEEIESAIDPLIDALDTDNENTRINACEALGYVGATKAIEDLEYRQEEDPSIEVRQAAGWALGQIPEYTS